MGYLSTDDHNCLLVCEGCIQSHIGTRGNWVIFFLHEPVIWHSQANSSVFTALWHSVAAQFAYQLTWGPSSHHHTSLQLLDVSTQSSSTNNLTINVWPTSHESADFKSQPTEPNRSIAQNDTLTDWQTTICVFLIPRLIHQWFTTSNSWFMFPQATDCKSYYHTTHTLPPLISAIPFSLLISNPRARPWTLQLSIACPTLWYIPYSSRRSVHNVWHLLGVIELVSTGPTSASSVKAQCSLWLTDLCGCRRIARLLSSMGLIKIFKSWENYEKKCC